ncbi:type 2 periplasmic-binding domain-containing protein [Chitinimonas naiadis]
MLINRVVQTLLLCCCATWVLGAETLRVLAWPGYADSDIVASFEQKTGAKVTVTIVDTDDAMWEMLSANEGRDFDVLAINTAELQRLIDNKLVQAISSADIPNLKLQHARFQNAAGIMRNGKRYAVPYTYSAMGLIYNKRLIPTPPTSITALWERKQRGKIALYEGSSHNFSITALAMGATDPFNLDNEQFKEAVGRLVALRSNRPYFYGTPEQAVALFQEHEIALMFGNYGSQQVSLLQKAGFDVGYVIPKEGALAWLDCWVVMKHAGSAALARSWINYMLTPEVGQVLARRQNLPNTLEAPANLRKQDKLYWLQPVENTQLRNQYWARILSGARRGMY